MAKVDTTDWGTKKRIESVSIPASLSSSGALNASGTQTIDVSSLVPAGTKAITLYMIGKDTTVASTCVADETGTGVGRIVLTAQVAGVYIRTIGDIQLTNGTFDIRNSAAWTSVGLNILAVYL